MAVVTDKIKSVVDFLVRGFEPRESFEDLADEMNEEDGYEIQDNLALAPKYSYQPKEDTSNELKVVNHPNYRGYEVMVMEPRSFDDAAQIEMLDIPQVAGFCTVAEDGTVSYYKKEAAFES